jgi:O-antigen/teichoic acid export membrane protein
MSIVVKLIKGGAWLTLANVIAKLASGISLPLLARLLGPETFGIFSVVFSVVQSAQGFSSLGADVAMHRNGSKHETTGSETVGRLFGVGFSIICLMSCLAGFGVWMFQKPLAQHWLGQPTVTPWLGMAAFLIVLSPFGNVPLLFLASLHDFRAYAIRSSLGMVLSSVLPVLLAWHYGLQGAIYGLMGGAIAQIIWSYLIVAPALRLKGIRLRVDQFWQESCAILKFGFPYYFGGTLLGSIVGLPIMGLVSQYGGLNQLGYLRAAQSLAVLIGFIPSAITPAAISYLSSSASQNPEAHQYLKSVHLRGVWILLLLPTAFASLIIPTIVEIFFGASYQAANIPSLLALWTALLVGVSSVLVQHLLADGKTKKIAHGSILGITSFIAAAFLLVPTYYTVGFLLAQIAGQITSLVFLSYPYWKTLTPRDSIALRNLLIITIATWLCTMPISLLNLSLYIRGGIALGLVLPLGILVARTALSAQERHKISIFLQLNFLYPKR